MERELLRKGYSYIAGVDEAGRGSLFGPVVAAAVILNPLSVPEGIRDSKKLSPARREELFNSIISCALSWAVGLGTLEQIEEGNILKATLQAMKQAVERLSPRPHIVVVDGPRRIGLDWVEELAVVNGDEKVVSVAAASILAKVVRDRIIVNMSRFFPEYHLDRNKGYATAQHLKSLAEKGRSVYHRWNFNVKSK